MHDIELVKKGLLCLTFNIVNEFPIDISLLLLLYVFLVGRTETRTKPHLCFNVATSLIAFNSDFTVCFT